MVQFEYVDICKFFKSLCTLSRVQSIMSSSSSPELNVSPEPQRKKLRRTKRGGAKNRASQVIHRLLWHYHHLQGTTRKQKLDEIRGKFRKILDENSVGLCFSVGAVEREGRFFVVTAAVRENMNWLHKTLCEIVDDVCGGNICVKLMLKHRANASSSSTPANDNTEMQAIDGSRWQTDEELSEEYLCWSIVKQLAFEREPLRKIIFGDGSKSKDEEPNEDRVDIDPPMCSICKNASWPARISDDGDWVCKTCSSKGSLTCHNCLSKSWNGYNRPLSEGGKWLCADCWSRDVGSHHVLWKKWFELRQKQYPGVLVEDEESQAILKKQHPSFEFDFSLARGSIQIWRSSVKEIGLGRDGWKHFEKCGYLNFQDVESIEVPEDFFRLFLASRKNRRGHSLALDFEDPIDVNHGWQYSAYKLSRNEEDGWVRGYHGTRWFSVYNILVNGFYETACGKSNKKGVFWYQDLTDGEFYQRYQLMPNGCAFCVVALLRCKWATTKGAGNRQLATPKGDVNLQGFLVRGYTQHELKVKKAKWNMTLVEMWDPRMEQNPWTCR